MTKDIKSQRKKKKYKDLNDFILNAPDKEFRAKQITLANKDLRLGGWLDSERLRVRGYTLI